MQIVKVGGSVVTKKDEPMVANLANISRLAEEINAAWPMPMILIHGGGSFGHTVAKKYGIAEGFKSERQVIGFTRTHQAMVTLNSIMIDALLAEGIPAISIAPSSFIITNEGRITQGDFENVGQLVVKGILPVLYGDAVIDKTRGFSILSGDQLAVKLSVSMGASKLIFGIDVDGVYTSNPKISPQARLIEKLTLDKLDGFVKIGKSLATDVTGGMLGKVSEAKIAVEAGIEVRLVNASRQGVILKALRGEPVAGTVITK